LRKNWHFRSNGIGIVLDNSNEPSIVTTTINPFGWAGGFVFNDPNTGDLVF